MELLDNQAHETIAIDIGFITWFMGLKQNSVYER